MPVVSAAGRTLRVLCFPHQVLSVSFRRRHALFSLHSSACFFSSASRSRLSLRVCTGGTTCSWLLSKSLRPPKAQRLPCSHSLPPRATSASGVQAHGVLASGSILPRSTCAIAAMRSRNSAVWGKNLASWRWSCNAFSSFAMPYLFASSDQSERNITAVSSAICWFGNAA